MNGFDWIVDYIPIPGQSPACFLQGAGRCGGRSRRRGKRIGWPAGHFLAIRRSPASLRSDHSCWVAGKARNWSWSARRLLWLSGCTRTHTGIRWWGRRKMEETSWQTAFSSLSLVMLMAVCNQQRTCSGRGKSWVVLFHIAAGADWAIREMQQMRNNKPKRKRKPVIVVAAAAAASSFPHSCDCCDSFFQTPLFQLLSPFLGCVFRPSPSFNCMSNLLGYQKLADHQAGVFKHRETGGHFAQKYVTSDSLAGCAAALSSCT